MEKLSHRFSIGDTPNWDGMKEVPATHEFKHENPFYFDGITYDEFLVEQCYYHTCIAQNIIKYKTLREQIVDGDIYCIPDEYKVSLPYPETCTAYANLLKGIKASA